MYFRRMKSHFLAARYNISILTIFISNALRKIAAGVEVVL